MYKLNKIASVAVLGLVSVSAVKAESYSDLIVGFTTQSGNDVLYDIVNGGTSLYNGETWSAATLGISAGSVGSYSWGVIGDNGDNSAPGTGTVWTTKAGLTPTKLNGGSAWGAVDTGITTVYGNAPGTIAATDPTSWNKETLNGTLGTDYLNAYLNPNTAGASTINFYEVIDNNTAPILTGTFSLASNGTLTFNTVSVTPPVPKITSVSRAGNNVTVFFTTTNAVFTYTLYYTNSTGLSAPVTSWPSSPTTVIGNGLTNSIMDTTTDTNRFYRIGVH